jgi:hypothetical protein
MSRPEQVKESRKPEEKIQIIQGDPGDHRKVSF